MKTERRKRSIAWIHLGAAIGFLLMSACHRGSASEGIPATAIRLVRPMGLAEDSGGDVYVSDRGDADRGPRIWKIDGNGPAVPFAGNGFRGTPLPGFPALESGLGSPESLAFDSTGRVDPDGRIHTTAG